MKRVISCWLFILLVIPSGLSAYEVITKDAPNVYPTNPNCSAGYSSYVRVTVSGTVKITEDSEVTNGGCFNVRIIEADGLDDDYLADCKVRFPAGAKNSVVKYYGVSPLLWIGISPSCWLVGPIEYSLSELWDVGFELHYAGANSPTVRVQAFSLGTMCGDEFENTVVPTTCEINGYPGDITKCFIPPTDTTIIAVPSLSGTGRIGLVIALLVTTAWVFFWRRKVVGSS